MAEHSNATCLLMPASSEASVRVFKSMRLSLMRLKLLPTGSQVVLWGLNSINLVGAKVNPREDLHGLMRLVFVSENAVTRIIAGQKKFLNMEKLTSPFLKVLL